MTHRAWTVAGAYTAAAIVMTWPLARGLGRDVAFDLGDSLLNMWILAWDCEQLLAILGGDLGRVRTFFDANIFYPEPLTLAYSEHLFAQAVQVLPVYLVTKNPILCYNLLFLSTFVLSGLGAYLFVRELTGSSRAGFVAGLMFGFALYRLPQSSHLQVLSSQWMPFTLYGLRRYFSTGRRLALAGATASLVAQNLSCGYYLLYFAPFLAAYALWEIAQRGLWTSRRVWRDLFVSALAASAATAPFLIPYAAVRERLSAARGIQEIRIFSADVYSYLTAFSEHRLWGPIARAFPKREGELFPGLLPVILAAIGIIAALRDANVARVGETPTRAPRWLPVLLTIVCVVFAALLGAVILFRRMSFYLGPIEVRMSDANRLIVQMVAALVVLLALSPRARASVTAFARDSSSFFLAALIASVWLSLGPVPQSFGRRVELAAPYLLLFEYVPGFDAVRVPARFGMVVALMLAVLAGFGAARIAKRRYGGFVLALAGAGFLVEAHGLPFVVNGLSPVSGFNTPEARVYRPARAPAVYHEAARLPRDAVILELPLGLPDFDLRAVYYSTAHWRPLINGYSGFFPPHYPLLLSALTDITRHTELSWQALRATGATHVILHDTAYLGDEGVRLSAWLRAAGAAELYRDRNDVLFDVRAGTPVALFVPGERWQPPRTQKQGSSLAARFRKCGIAPGDGRCLATPSWWPSFLPSASTESSRTSGS
jgi:hypothetical protein